MPGLVPGIHVFTVPRIRRRWMAGRNPAVTRKPYEQRHHPPRYPAPINHPLPHHRQHQRPAHACARSRLRDIRPTLRAAAARLSRTRVLLAQGDADARRRRLSRDCAGPARYGRTTGWSADYDGDLNPFRLTNLVRDALGLVSAFGYSHVDAVFGHDFGSSV